jgi:LacI family transcriptional regulator
VLNGRTNVKIPDATRQRVISAATRLGYHPYGPARRMVAGKSHVIALVLRQSPEQIAGDAVLVETLLGLAGTVRKDGFRVLVEPIAPNGHDSDLELLVRAHHADGLIISGPRIDDPSLLGLAEADLPIVIQGAFPGMPAASVDVDNVAGARRAVEHLIALGHDRIACITNAPLAYTAAQDRLDGYRQAMTAAGLPTPKELVVEASFDAPSGRAAMNELLARATFSAVFVASDVVALGALAALREAGRQVPDDVSVVGFDDIPLAAYLDPALTTVRLPAYELGQAAGRALLERISQRSMPTRTLLPTELVVRASTAPPAAAGRRPT